jgi:hypothetical protein
MSVTRDKQDRKSMNCAEFQERLPELFESGANVGNHEHVLGCENCSALVRDLEYIASQAKLLLPIHDPSPSVWDNIQTAIRNDPDRKASVTSVKRP